MNKVLTYAKSVVDWISRLCLTASSKSDATTAPSTIPTANGLGGKKVIRVVRRRTTSDGIFGVMTVDGSPFQCFTVERLIQAIPTGTYGIVFDFSPHLQITTPHILVPARDAAAGGDAGIRIHPANFPLQLHGCIAVGDKAEPDAVDDSRDTFVRLMTALQGKPTSILVQECL